MRKQTSSLDGFVPRRPNSMSKIAQAGEARENLSARPQLTENDIEQRGMRRRDIDESLAGIDNEEPQPKKRRRLFHRRQRGRVLTRRQKIIRRTIKFLIIIIILAGAFVAIKTFIATNNILQGNIFDILQNKPLKMDANGRTNILLFGTSEDDPGHEAGSLTDSIMMVSIDQKQKNAYMVSIPRDLYVDYGTACSAGYQGKINVIYGCYSNDGKKEAAGASALGKKVGDVLGLDVHYYAHVNYTVVRDVVKALDGITVTIESRDPRGVMDSNFDWKCKKGNAYASYATILKNCPPNGHFIDYPNGKVKLDAEHALYLAQARGDAAPTYGLEQSNFDREKNQQKIVKAITEKAVSAGTITNLGKVTGLIDALGNNLRTDFEVSEVRTLMQLAESIPSDRIKSISLIEEGNELVTTATIGASVVVPAAGTYDYSQIQAYVAKKLSKDPVVREAASIFVLNGTTTPGLAQSEAAKLTAAKYVITATDNAATDDYQKTVVYRLNKKSDVDGTAKTLATRYSVKLKTGALPFAISGNPDFVIIVGADVAATKTN
ncbi:cell envelope-related function transcriptional attenuator, LytR/CpsA family protein, nonfunctional [Candidatus Saccharibacteria bacterium RAAC3_TM7_1]|nr:cell envelope-related function transcriptional attenuator, LytR/CpsA family protein, nonfunctional [Candidatus Saccharibacteria bacterium RAAC3_TM7_1]